MAAGQPVAGRPPRHAPQPPAGSAAGPARLAGPGGRRACAGKMLGCVGSNSGHHSITTAAAKHRPSALTPQPHFLQHMWAGPALHPHPPAGALIPPAPAHLRQRPCGPAGCAAPRCPRPARASAAPSPPPAAQCRHCRMGMSRGTPLIRAMLAAPVSSIACCLAPPQQSQLPRACCT